MTKRINILFLLLVLAHIIHATEEYFGQLWDSYAPAIFICNLISSNPERGFLIINIVFVIISFSYWKFSLQKANVPSHSLIWFWILLQSANGIGHIAWTISKESYTPGVLSAILILALVWLLIKQLADRAIQQKY